MDELRQNVRFALRSLAMRPGFTLVALATLALGIGLNTGMFSVVRAVLLEPLPYADAERIVQVRLVDDAGGADDGLFSWPDFEDVRGATTSFSPLASYWYAPGVSEASIASPGEPASLEAAFVSAEFFGLLGVVPVAGRLPTADEMVEGGDAVAVLSHGEWQARFGGRPEAIGSTILVSGTPVTLLAVMPPEFGYPSETVRVWLPLSRISTAMIPRERHVRFLRGVGRLSPGVEPAAATAEMSALTSRLAEQYSDTNRGRDRVQLAGLREAMLGSVRTPLMVLTGAVAFVLLIACANLVNLLLSRAASRRGEFAVRAALGAGRGRIVRQMVTESTVLALVGGGAGILAATWLTSLVLGTGAANLPRVQHVSLDAPVLLFALLLSVLAGVLTGVIPAFRSAGSAAAAIRDEGRSGTEGRQRHRLRGTLIAGEMALAVVLVIAAGLMVRSLTALLRVDPGFQAEQIVGVSLRMGGDDLQERIAYRNSLADRLAALPGVTQVAMAKSLPLEGVGEPFDFGMPGREPATFAPEAGVMTVNAEYFTALGIPLLRGRLFDEREVRDAEGGFGPGFEYTMVINDAAARRYFPGEDPVGQRVTFLTEQIRIIGVVGDVRHLGLHAAPAPAAYMPIDVLPRTTIRFMLRVEGDPALLITPIRNAIREVNPAQPIAAIIPLRDTISRAAARERFLATLLTGFAIMALLLAAMGIYGVVAYSVSQRTREMGIRMALGAVPSSVAGMVIRESALWWGAGLLAGVVLALAAVRLLQGLVYGVSVTDPATFLLVPLILGGAALLASVLPAVRASRADPTSAFR
jgi:predicted permease